MIGRNTSTCAGADMSIQIFIGERPVGREARDFRGRRSRLDIHWRAPVERLGRLARVEAVSAELWRFSSEGWNPGAKVPGTAGTLAPGMGGVHATGHRSRTRG